jgi:alkylhydroperoxidase/carboxymuconolactone decarboxylase family protein YurZ
MEILLASLMGVWSAQASDVRAVAPALEKYTQSYLLGGVWKRPGLSARDRSVVTVAVLVARNQTVEMPFYVNLALDSGVKPAEISELITHLAFYSGWGNAMSAVAVTKEVFARRGIATDQLASASPKPLPLDEAAEAARAKQVAQQFGAISPGVVQYTTDALFHDLWLRPDLAPRDQPCHGGCAGRVGPSGTDALSRAQGHGQRPHPRAGGGDAHTPGALCGLAQGFFGAAGREGRVRETPEIDELAMNISVENQVALVTGAASGLGLATAKAFAESGEAASSRPKVVTVCATIAST